MLLLIIYTMSCTYYSSTILPSLVCSTTTQHAVHTKPSSTGLVRTAKARQWDRSPPQEPSLASALAQKPALVDVLKATSQCRPSNAETVRDLGYRYISCESILTK